MSKYTLTKVDQQIRLQLTKDRTLWRAVNLDRSRMTEREATIYLFGVACLSGVNPKEIHINYKTIKEFEV